MKGSPVSVSDEAEEEPALGLLRQSARTAYMYRCVDARLPTATSPTLNVGRLTSS